jgi:glycosyltransferase involved in cell wall biosynthesis
MKNKVMIIGPLPPGIGGIATIVSMLKERMAGVEFLDSSKVDSLLGKISLPVSLVLKMIVFCIQTRNAKVLFFSSAHRSFLEKSVWAILARFLGAHVYVVMVDGNFPDFYSSLPPVGRLFANFAMKRITVVGQSKSWCDYYRSIFPKSNIDEISGGVDTNFFMPSSTSEEQRSEVIKILYVGWIIKEKGIYDILEACNLLGVKLNSVSVELVGPIYCNIKELKLKVENLDLQDIVYVPGPIQSREELKQKYQSADIFIFPSHFEGFPVALLEALSCGLPCIGSDVGGIPDIIEHGQSGLIVKKQNIDALAGAIEHLINNKQLRLKFSEAARKRALKYFSIEASAKSYQVILGF